MNRLWQRQVKMIDVVLQNTAHKPPQLYNKSFCSFHCVPDFSRLFRRSAAKTSQPTLFMDSEWHLNKSKIYMSLSMSQTLRHI